MRVLLVLAAACACLFVTSRVVRAEMGSPAQKGGAYVSIEGGYQNSDAPGVAARGDSQVTNGTPGANGGGGGGGGGSTAGAGFGSGTAGAGTGGGLGVGAPAFAFAGAFSGSESAAANSDGGSFVSADDGPYGGLGIGYVLPSRLFGVVSRIEAYGTLSKSDNNQTTFGAIGMRSVDNNAVVAIAAVPIENLPVHVSQTLDRGEIGLRLKADQQTGPAGFAFSVEPFYIHYSQETETRAKLPRIGGNVAPFPAIATRHSDVDGDFYGAQIALEGAIPIFGPVSLIGRGSAGVYHVDANADFRSFFRFDFVAPYRGNVSDSASDTGYRLGGEGGVRVALSDAAWLSLTGQVDYLSEVPTAVLPRENSDPVARIGFDDLFDWRIGARLTMAASP